MTYLNEVIKIFIWSTILALSSGFPALNNNFLGNCSNASFDTRVYQDHIVKTGWPLIVRSETIHYRGDNTIFCMELSNLMGNETGGTATVLDGGVGHSYVDIDIESIRGYGLDWNVTIYANKTISDSPAVLLSVINNVVYP
ncbi:uncharacterized protein LOC126746956 isoform X2 [Anthonomus grandis grandis]|uniref:uncharacterized protein LOC126746956 isoform X2 n=1 Tax=Anthonomus grandis grandis TaxID=2921223 RepID=UPI00216596E5|nr:uncharacterized protein LOC126746956 isoform X2 [Anthonomus grandis grandis]